MPRGLKDYEIKEELQQLHFDESDDCSDGEDITTNYEQWQFVFSSDSKSEGSDLNEAPDDPDEFQIIDEDLHHTVYDENMSVDSPAFPSPEICTPPRLTRQPRAFIRGRRPARGSSRGQQRLQRGISRGRWPTRGRPVNRGRGARIRGQNRVSQRGEHYVSSEWNAIKLATKIPELTQPAYVYRDRSDSNPFDFLKDYIDDNLLQTMVTATKELQLLTWVKVWV